MVLEKGGELFFFCETALTGTRKHHGGRPKGLLSWSRSRGLPSKPANRWPLVFAVVPSSLRRGWVRILPKWALVSDMTSTAPIKNSGVHFCGGKRAPPPPFGRVAHLWVRATRPPGGPRGQPRGHRVHPPPALLRHDRLPRLDLRLLPRALCWGGGPSPLPPPSRLPWDCGRRAKECLRQKSSFVR